MGNSNKSEIIAAREMGFLNEIVNTNRQHRIRNANIILEELNENALYSGTMCHINLFKCQRQHMVASKHDDFSCFDETSLHIINYLGYVE